MSNPSTWIIDLSLDGEFFSFLELEILSITTWNGNTKTLFVNQAALNDHELANKNKDNKILLFPKEIDMLSAFCALLNKGDTIVGYGIQTCEIPVLKSRLKLHDFDDVLLMFPELVFKDLYDIVKKKPTHLLQSYSLVSVTKWFANKIGHQEILKSVEVANNAGDLFERRFAYMDMIVFVYQNLLQSQ